MLEIKNIFHIVEILLPEIEQLLYNCNFHITIFIRKGSMIKKFDNFPNFLSPKLKNQFPVRKIRLFALRKNKSRLRNLIR